MNLPRVLIIGQSFNNISGGGITQSNLFSGWEKEKIAVACTAHLLYNSSFDICTNYYQLGQKEHKWIFPFNLVQRKFNSGPLQMAENNVYSVENEKITFRSKLVNKLFYPFLKYTGLFHCFSKINLSQDFCEWLDKFKPDVIYAQAQDRERVLFAILLQSYLKKPLIFHMMDDWPTTIKNKGLFKKYWHKRIDDDFKNLLNKASLLMSISDSMANEYQIRYQKKFKTFHNPIKIDFWQQHQRVNYDLSNYPTLLYAGRIGLGIETSLELIAKAVDSLNQEWRMSIRLVLQTSQKPLWADKYPCIIYKSFVSYDNLPKAFSEADFLLIPYDFSKESISYIQYSMPTKAPEYMISGTPIIILSPRITAVVEYAKKHDWAKVITQNEVYEIAIGIKQLIENKELRKRIAQNAITIAKKNHDSARVTDDFRQAIKSLSIESNQNSNMLLDIVNVA